MAVQDLWMKNAPKKPDGSRGPKIRSARWGRGQRWRVAVEDPNTGKVITEAHETETEAQSRDVILRASILQGTYVDPREGKVTVAEAAETWRKDQLHSPQTAERVESIIRRHIVPVLGHLPRAAVRSSHIKHWVKNRSAVLGPLTVRMIYGGILAPMFKQWALDRAGVGVSPCSGIRMPELNSDEYFIPPAQKIYDLADALPHRFRPVPLIAAGMGWRGGEIFGAELSDDPKRSSFDFLRRVGHVRQQPIKIVGEAPYLDTPKSKLSRRTNDMPDVVAEVLSEHIRLFPPREMEIVDKTNPRKVVTRKVRLLFTTGTNLPLYGAKWARVWPEAVEKVGLPKGFGLHGMRHFFATRLIYGGANVKSVQLALGHSKPSITLDTYTSYWPDFVDSCRALLNEALAIEKPAGKATAE